MSSGLRVYSTMASMLRLVGETYTYRDVTAVHDPDTGLSTPGTPSNTPLYARTRALDAKEIELNGLAAGAVQITVPSSFFASDTPKVGNYMIRATGSQTFVVRRSTTLISGTSPYAYAMLCDATELH